LFVRTYFVILDNICSIKNLSTMQNHLNTQNPNHYIYQTKYLTINVLGGIRFNNLEALRVTLGLQKVDSLHTIRQSVDLYNDTTVEKLTRKIAERLEIGTTIIRQALDELTSVLESYRLNYLEESAKNYEKQVKVLTENEIKQAKTFLENKDLINNTQEKIGKSGVIGEEINRLLMYLIFTSRKTNNPLHCISLGSSGAGKTHLQSKVGELIPEEDKIEMTALSANAFYYFNRTELRGKLILIEDLDGAESVLYPLRELQSKKKITKTVVHKDRNGTTKTIHLTVEGPVSVSGCTTQESIYEDNSNRSFLLYIDESEAQDEKIMNYQRKASAGSINQEEEIQSQQLLQNCQRLLKTITVKNRYAEYLSLPQSVFKPRRTNAHYLQFIEVITFYKQYQKEHKTDEETGEEYIETDIEDIKEANELIKEVLLRKSDILTGQDRNIYENLKQHLERESQRNFTNPMIRRWFRLPKSTVQRRIQTWLDADLIRKINDKKTKTYWYEIANKSEYNVLEEAIHQALTESIDKINRPIEPPRTTSNQTQNKSIKVNKNAQSNPSNQEM
jgi:predicted transcriptional regulator